jgi:hypothetical protein
MPAALAGGLESLSAYRHIFPPGDPGAERNPVAWSHVKLSAGGKTYNVLSRVGDYGLDYSHRGNKLAHHLVLEPHELPAGGPAWLLAQPGFMTSSWDGNPRLLAKGRSPRTGTAPPSACRAWREATGDAGWGGVLAESFLANPERPAYIVFEPGIEMLPLLAEAIALLPAERRWDVTFSTYFTNLAPGVVCNWRCVLADSAEVDQARRLAPHLQINLCGRLPTATGGELVKLARPGPETSATRMPGWRLADGALDQCATANIEGEPAGDSEPLDSVEQEPEEYVLQAGAAIPRGMPPPPPARRRRRLAELNEQERLKRLKLRKRQMAAAAAVLVLMIVAGVGTWLFREPLFGAHQVKADRARQVAEEEKPQRKKNPESKEATVAKRGRSKSHELPGSINKPPGESDAASPGASDSGEADESEKAEGRLTAASSSASGASSAAAQLSANKDDEDDSKPDEPQENPAPPQATIAIRYNGQPLEPRAASGHYFLAPEPNATLEIAARSAGLNWRLLIPEGEARGLRVESPPATQPFAQKLVGTSSEGAGGLVTLFALREKSRQAGEPSSVVVGFHPGNDAGALADRIRWAAVEIETSDARRELVVLHQLAALPELRQLEKGRVAWRLDAWGGSAPRLSVEKIVLDVQLTDSRLPLVFEAEDDDEANPARLVCSGGSLDLLRKRQEVGAWSEDLSVPQLQVSQKVKADEDGKKFVELAISVPALAAKKLDEDLSAMSKRLSSLPPAFGVKPKLDAGALGAEGIRTALAKIEEKLKDAEDSSSPDAPLQFLKTLQTDLKQLERRAKLAAASRQRLASANVAGARIFYRLEGRDDQIDVVNSGDSADSSSARRKAPQ